MEKENILKFKFLGNTLKFITKNIFYLLCTCCWCSVPSAAFRIWLPCKCCSYYCRMHDSGVVWDSLGRAGT